MSTATTPQIISYGHALDLSDDKFGQLRDSADAADDMLELRRRFAEDGYIHIKGYLDRDLVLEARAALTDRLAEAGVLDPAYPTIEGVAKPDAGYIFKPEIANGCAPVQKLLYAPDGRLINFYRQFYGEEIRH